MPWYDLTSNICWLGHYLHDELGYSFNDVMYMVEKPWKYEDEWYAYLHWRDAELIGEEE